MNISPTGLLRGLKIFCSLRHQGGTRPIRKSHIILCFFPWPEFVAHVFLRMSIHTPVTKSGIYFITFTCHEWLPLIGLTNGYNLVYNWFDIMTTKSHTVNGYVIMPNHLHLLLHYLHGKSSLNSVIGNGKPFMAYDIVDSLDEKNPLSLLSKLQLSVKPADRKKGAKHEVWKDSFDVKECRTDNFILQKLNYIYNNPCSGKWNLAVHPIDYLHSSARFYFSGNQGHYPVKDYRDLLNVNLWDE